MGRFNKLALAFTFLFLIGLYLLSLHKFSMDPAILDFQVKAWGMDSNKYHSIFYLSLVGLIAASCLIILLSRNDRVTISQSMADRVIFFVIIVMSIVFGTCSRVFMMSFVGFFFVLMVLNINYFQVTILKIFESRESSSRLLTFCERWIPPGLLAGYLLVFMILPIGFPLLVGDATTFSFVEFHYAETVLRGFSLNMYGGIESCSGYGLGMTLLTALVLKVYQLIGLPGTAIVQSVKVNQVVFVILLGILCYILNRKHFLVLILLVLGVTSFTLSNIGMSLIAPNQSGVRFIPVLVLLIFISMEFKRECPRFWILAIVSAICTVMNPETGIAATAGSLVGVVLHGYSHKKPFVSLVTPFVGFVFISIAVYFVLSHVFMQLFFVGNTSINGGFSAVTLSFLKSFAGLSSKPSITAILFFFIAVSVLLRTVVKARLGLLDPIFVHRAAVATIILVWLMYYVNRMAEWNLWFQWVLLITLFAPSLSHDAIKRIFKRDLGYDSMCVIMVVALFGAQFLYSSCDAFNQVKSFIGSHKHCDIKTIQYERCMPWFPGSQYDIQLRFLLENYSKENTFVLTRASSFIRLHGYNFGFPWYDSISVHTKRDVNIITEWIERNGKKYLLMDDPAYEVARSAPELSKQVLSYIPHLASYREIDRKYGWIILEKLR